MATATEDDDVEIAGLLGHAQESTDAVRPVTAPNVLVRGTRHSDLGLGPDPYADDQG